MSVTFFNPKNPAEFDDDDDLVGGGIEINVSNSNARELLTFVGIPGDDDDDDLCGQILAKDLEVLCRRKLMVLSVKGADPAFPPSQMGNIIFCGRSEGYLETRVHELLRLAQERTSDADLIVWS